MVTNGSMGENFMLFSVTAVHKISVLIRTLRVKLGDGLSLDVKVLRWRMHQKNSINRIIRLYVDYLNRRSFFGYI